MGYTTEFTGFVTVSPPLNPAEIAYLDQFSDTRRMNRPAGPYATTDDSYADLVKERDELQAANTRLEEKVDTARDEIEETLRGLNR
ncbi:MAG TPA: hypothetical protein VM428_11120 [Microlunatus sp.]|nr:hypothetical protein [Microlunatus sp.]